MCSLPKHTKSTRKGGPVLQRLQRNMPVATPSETMGLLKPACIKPETLKTRFLDTLEMKQL